MSGLAKRRGGIAGDDELDMDDDIGFEDVPEKIQEKVENSSPEQLKPKGVVPPPPGPMPIKIESSNPTVGNMPSKPVPEKSNLLDQIKSGGMVLKSAGSRSNPLDQGQFKYSEIQKKSGMEAMLGGEYDAPSLVNGKDKSQQMNTLYSAVVEGNTKLTKELVDITVEVNTGKTIEDDWGDIVPVTETKKVYTKDDLEKIHSAVKSLDSKEGLSKVQKINMERGLAEVSKAAGINVEGKGRA